MENQNNPKSPNGNPTTSQQQWKQLEAERRDWERRKAERGLDDLYDQSDLDAWRDMTGTQDATQTAEANDATGSDSDAFERARAEGEYILETGNYPQAEPEEPEAESADLQARLDALEERLKQLEGGNSGNKPDGENRPKHLKAGESWDNNPPEDEEGTSPEAESAPDNTGANVATGSDSDAFDQARFDYIAETGTDPWAEPEEPEAESASDNAGDGVEDKVPNDQEPEPEQKTGDDVGADQNTGEGNGNVPGGEDNNNSPEGEQPKTDNAKNALQSEWSAEADGLIYLVDDAEGEPKNPNTAIVPFSGGGVPAKVGGGTKKSPQDLGPATQVVGGTVDKTSFETLVKESAQKRFNQQKLDLKERRKSMNIFERAVDLGINSALKRGFLASFTKLGFEGQTRRDLETMLAEKGVKVEGGTLSKEKAGGEKKTLVDKFTNWLTDSRMSEKTRRAEREVLAKYADTALLRNALGAEAGETGNSNANRMVKLLEKNEKLAKISGLDTVLAVKDSELVADEGGEARSVNALMLDMVGALKGAESSEARAKMLENFNRSMSNQGVSWAAAESAGLTAGEMEFFMAEAGENGELGQSQFMKLVDNLAQAEATDDEIKNYTEKFALYRSENLNLTGSEHEKLGGRSLADSLAGRITDKLGYPIAGIVGGALGYVGSSRARGAIRAALVASGFGTFWAGAVAGGLIGVAKGIVGSKENVRNALHDEMVEGKAINQEAGWTETGPGDGETMEAYRARHMDYLRSFFQGEVMEKEGGIGQYLNNLEALMNDTEHPRPANALQLNMLAERFNDMSAEDLAQPENQAQAKQLTGIMTALQNRMDDGFWQALSYSGRSDAPAQQLAMKQNISALYDKLVGGYDADGSPVNSAVATELSNFVNGKNTGDDWDAWVKAGHNQISKKRFGYILRTGLTGGAIGGAMAATTTIGAEMLGGSTLREAANDAFRFAGHDLFGEAAATAGIAGAVSADTGETAEVERINNVEFEEGDVEGDGIGTFRYVDSQGHNRSINVNFSTPEDATRSLETLQQHGFDVSSTERFNYSVGDSVSAEEYVAYAQNAAKVLERENVDSDVVIGAVEKADLVGDDGIPDTWVVNVSSAGGTNVDDLDLALTLNNATSSSVLLYDIEGGQAQIPIETGLISDSGRFNTLNTEVVENVGGKIRSFFSVGGDGVDRLVNVDKYSIFDYLVSADNKTFDFATEEAYDSSTLAMHLEKYNSELDKNNSVTVTDQNGETKTIYGVKENEGYNADSDPYGFAGKQSTGAFGINAYDDGASTADIYQEYLVDVSESPEQMSIAAVYSGIDLSGYNIPGLDGDIDTEAELNAVADWYENAGNAVQMEVMSKIREGITSKLSGGSITMDELSNYPITNSSYISGSSGATTLDFYTRSTTAHTGHGLMLLDKDGNNILDTPAMRKIFSISDDADAKIMLRPECGFQVVASQETPNVDNYAPVVTTTTTTTPATTTTTTPTSTPSTPDEPTTPTTPDEPDEPDEPTTPTTPDEPDEPTTTVTPKDPTADPVNNGNANTGGGKNDTTEAGEQVDEHSSTSTGSSSTTGDNSSAGSSTSGGSSSSSGSDTGSSSSGSTSFGTEAPKTDPIEPTTSTPVVDVSTGESADLAEEVADGEIAMPD